MRGLRVDSDGPWWSFVRRPGHCTLAVGMFASTLALGVPLAIATALWPEVWVVFIALTVPAIAGLVLMGAGGRILVNPTVPSLHIDGEKLGGFEFTGVLVETSTRTVQTEHGTAEVREWSVELARTYSDPGRIQAVEVARAALEQSLERNAAAKTRLLGLLDEHRELLERRRLPVMTTSRQLEAWQLAIRLAESLKLPLVDLVEGELFECTPGQLDTPLVDRLAAREHRPEDPGPSPGSATVERNAGTRRITWNHRMHGIHFGLSFGAALLVAAGGLSLLDGELREFGQIGGAVFGLMGLWSIVMCVAMLRGDGPNVLEVDAQRIRYTTSRPWRRVDEVSLDIVRRIRPNRLQERTFVSVMGRQWIMKLHIPSSEVVWLWRKLEHEILSIASGSTHLHQR